MSELFTIEPGDVLYGTRELCFHGKKAKTLKESFQISKEKWRILRDNAPTQEAQDKGAEPIVDGGFSTCGFCQMFVSNNCKGCPIQEDTGRMLCWGTPYEDYDEKHDPESAQAMLDYIEELEKEYDAS